MDSDGEIMISDCQQCWSMMDRMMINIGTVWVITSHPRLGSGSHPISATSQEYRVLAHSNIGWCWLVLVDDG